MRFFFHIPFKANYKEKKKTAKKNVIVPHTRHCINDNNQAYKSPHATNYSIRFALWPSRHATYFFAVVTDRILILFLISMYLHEMNEKKNKGRNVCSWMCLCVHLKHCRFCRSHCDRVMFRFVCTSTLIQRCTRL